MMKVKSWLKQCNIVAFIIVFCVKDIRSEKSSSRGGKFSFLSILKINEDAKLKAAGHILSDDNSNDESKLYNNERNATATRLVNASRAGGSLTILRADEQYTNNDESNDSHDSGDSESGVYRQSQSLSMIYEEDSYDDIEYEDESDNESILEEDYFEDNSKSISAFQNGSSTNEDNIPIETSYFSETPLLENDSPYISSGLWQTIDVITSLGLSTYTDTLRISRKLRTLRKVAARTTGMHGVLSGKRLNHSLNETRNAELKSELDDETLESVRKRIEAIETARAAAARANSLQKGPVRQGVWGRIVRRRTRTQRIQEERQDIQNNNFEIADDIDSDDESWEASTQQEVRKNKTEHVDRIKEIDRLILKGQEELVKLQCEKDSLQSRPNPLFKYSNLASSNTPTNVSTSRMFDFPNDSIVDEYIDELVLSNRLTFLNHTHLWQSNNNIDDDEDDIVTDDIYIKKNISAEVEREIPRLRNILKGNPTLGGNWLLRQTIPGGGVTLGEKVCETAEAAAYKAVCASIMSVLARSISGLHGLNIMGHSDIRIYLGAAPDLPPVGKFAKDHNYAMEAIQKAIRRGSARKQGKTINEYESEYFSKELFLQRAALVETLISHCQISAPLLKMFPMAWQRALLGNIITLITSIIADFCAGIRISILGHYLSLSFKPITEADMIRNLSMGNQRRTKALGGKFEDAVAATAKDIAKKLTFLDKWHERLLGGDMLRIQIGTLIARVVLSLVEEVLRGFEIALWSSEAGGPMVYAELEYRQSENSDENQFQ